MHGGVTLGVVLDLRLHKVVEVPEVVGLDGAESLHQQLGDLHLLVVLGLGDAKFVLGLSTIEQSVLVWKSPDTRPTLPRTSVGAFQHPSPNISSIGSRG